MKLLLAAALMFVGANAQADVVYKQPANDASACTTPVQKQQVRQYYRGKHSVAKPSCLKLGGVKASTPAINNCKTAFQKSAFRQYQNGKAMNPPSCYKPAKFYVHAKSSASCNFHDKTKVRRIMNGKADVMEKFPACYK